MKRSNGLRLLDVPAGKRRWDPANAERLRLLRMEIKKPAADERPTKGMK